MDTKKAIIFIIIAIFPIFEKSQEVSLLSQLRAFHFHRTVIILLPIKQYVFVSLRTKVSKSLGFKFFSINILRTIKGARE